QQPPIVSDYSKTPIRQNSCDRHFLPRVPLANRCCGAQNFDSALNCRLFGWLSAGRCRAQPENESAPPGGGAAGRPAPVPGSSALAGAALILFPDGRGGPEDGPAVVGRHEVTVGDLDRGGVLAGQHVHPVVVAPERADRDPPQPV